MSLGGISIWKLKKLAFEKFRRWLHRNFGKKREFEFGADYYYRKTSQELDDNKKISKFCNICGDLPSVVESFFCKYCENYHCKKHRLPEDHNCKNPKRPRGMTSGRVTYSKGNTTHHTK